MDELDIRLHAAVQARRQLAMKERERHQIVLIDHPATNRFIFKKDEEILALHNLVTALEQPAPHLSNW
jgi:hypothetical protein